MKDNFLGYICACGCVHQASGVVAKRSRQSKEMHKHRFCSIHHYDGPVIGKKYKCRKCGIDFTVPYSRSRDMHLCKKCKKHRDLNSVTSSVSSNRIHDCEHYDECLWSKPVEPKFNCHICGKYKVESMELKIKRNSRTVSAFSCNTTDDDLYNNHYENKKGSYNV